MGEKEDRFEKMNTQTDDNQVGACHALWIYNRGETEEWNGMGCDCEHIQGNLVCKLNPF